MLGNFARVTGGTRVEKMIAKDGIIGPVPGDCEPDRWGILSNVHHCPGGDGFNNPSAILGGHNRVDKCSFDLWAILGPETKGTSKNHPWWVLFNRIVYSVMSRVEDVTCRDGEYPQTCGGGGGASCALEHRWNVRANAPGGR
jgi:hypothetical protein